jgi:hypothetical protein
MLEGGQMAGSPKLSGITTGAPAHLSAPLLSRPIRPLP